MKVRYSPRARADIDHISWYLQQRSRSGAYNVLQAIHSTIQLIAEHPEAAQRTDNPDIRVRLVRRYRYRIFYAVADETIDILHVRHTSRQIWEGD